MNTLLTTKAIFDSQVSWKPTLINDTGTAQIELPSEGYSRDAIEMVISMSDFLEYRTDCQTLYITDGKNTLVFAVRSIAIQDGEIQITAIKK